MNKYDKVNVIKELIDVPDTAEKYYELLENMGDLKTDYHLTQQQSLLIAIKNWNVFPMQITNYAQPYSQ